MTGPTRQCGGERTLTFATPGVRTVRARFTDDAGAVTTTTATVEPHTENFAPRVSVQASTGNGSFSIGVPLVAGSAVLTAYADDPDGTVAGFDFDLDGDGSYETHAAPGRHLPAGRRRRREDDLRRRATTRSARA